MIPQKVYVYNNGQPIVVHDTNQYDFYLYFQTSAKANFLQVGDIIVADDSGINHNYRIIDWTNHPTAFSDGDLVTVEAITTGDNVAPDEDSDFISDLTTPTLIDYNPIVSTYGTCSNPSIYNAANFEYNLSVSLTVTTQANKVVVGDFLADTNARIYRISHIELIGGVPNFTQPIRVVDIDQFGEVPTIGGITVYRPSSKLKLSSPHAQNLTTEIITKIRNRDNQVVDYNLYSDKEKIITTSTDVTNGYVVLTSTLAGIADISVQTYLNGIMIDWDDYTISNASKRLILTDQPFDVDDKIFVFYERRVTTI
jgi:hypothetical protein